MQATFLGRLTGTAKVQKPLPQRDIPVLASKRRIYRVCIGLVAVSTSFMLLNVVRGQENYPALWPYFLTGTVVLLSCLGAILALQNLRNVRRVEFFLTFASASYLFYWDIVAFATHYQPRAEFLMTSVAEFLMTAALFCLTLPRRWLLAALLALFACHDLLVWGNLLEFRWSPVHNAQVMSDLLSFVTMLALSLIGTYQGMVADSHREADVLERLANTDSLTGLANRRHIYAQVQQLAQKTEGFAALLMDVDDFKRVNDTYGHDIGDEVLVQVARTLEQTLGPAAWVARWGGEEFIAVLPSQNQPAALTAAESLRAAVQNATQHHWPVTLSIGVALHQSGENADATLRRADEAMYSAKRSGKNRVVLLNDDGFASLIDDR